MNPVKIPGNAAGTTRLIVCHLLAPKPKEASRTERYSSNRFLTGNNNDWQNQ